MARGVAILAAIAVSLLAVSGAGGAARADSEAWRHGRHRDGHSGAGVPQRVRDCVLTRAAFLVEVLGGAFDVKSGRHVQAGPRFRLPHVVSKQPVHARLPHPSRGALERRRSRHRVGLRLHRRGVCGSTVRTSGLATRTMFVASVRLDAKTVKVVLRERCPRLALSLHDASCRDTLWPAMDLQECLEGCGSTIPRRDDADRERPLPRSGTGIVARQTHARPKPALLGSRTAPTSDRLVYRFLPSGGRRRGVAQRRDRHDRSQSRGAEGRRR